MPDAVIFDLDGVLLDSEQLWNRAKEAVVRSTGGRWREDAPRAMMGMSSREWASYLRDDLGVPLDTADINREVVRRIEAFYRERLPLLPGATDVVREMHSHWPLGLASSSNREIIDMVLDLAGLAAAFVTTVSSEEVENGKPAPDVYLQTAERMGAAPRRCVAVEDSSNGLRSAAAAGMAVIAVPNRHYPPDEDSLMVAGATVQAIRDVTWELVERVSHG